MHQQPNTNTIPSRLTSAKPISFGRLVATSLYIQSAVFLPIDELECLRLQVQTLRRNNIPANLLQRYLELLLEFGVAHDFRGLGHLTEKFFETAEDADERSLVDVGHFTVIILLAWIWKERLGKGKNIPNLKEGFSMSPFVDDLH